MKTKQFIDYMNGLSYFLINDKNTSEAECSLFNKIVAEFKNLLTKDEKRRYNYNLLAIQKRLNSIKDKSDSKIVDFEKTLLKLKMKM